MKNALILTLATLICCFATCDFAMAQNTGSGMPLSRHFSNSKYSIDYPSTWEVETNNEYAVGTASLVLMETPTNNYDFIPSLNIVKLSGKSLESTSELAKTALKWVRTGAQISGGQNFSFIGQTDNLVLSNMNCSMIEVEWTYMGYRMCQRQYVLKKLDSTVYAVTIAWDKKVPSKKNDLLRILNTLYIK